MSFFTLLIKLSRTSCWFGHPVDVDLVSMSNSMKNSVTAHCKGAAPKTYHEITSTRINSAPPRSMLSLLAYSVYMSILALTNVLQQSSPILPFNPLKIRLQRDTHEEVFITWLWSEPCHLVQSHKKQGKIWIPFYSQNQTGKHQKVNMEKIHVHNHQQWCCTLPYVIKRITSMLPSNPTTLYIRN